jgi:type III secretion system low calcium response chaperone LcrH/SycD
MRFDPSALSEQAFDNLLDHLRSGGTLGAELGLSLRSQKAMYQLAYLLYGQNKYEEARRLFSMLVICQHTDRRHHLGLAACLQMLQRHAEALKHYGIASVLDLTDPVPVLHAAECHLALAEREKARHALDYALAQARAHAAHRKHLPRLEALAALMDTGATAFRPTSE